MIQSLRQGLVGFPMLKGKSIREDGHEAGWHHDVV
jgi:hypothetical protein